MSGGSKRYRVMAIATVFLMVLSSFGFIQGTSDDSEAASSDSWVCTITITNNSDGTSTVKTQYAKNGAILSDTLAVNGNDGKATAGSWGFSKYTGYGPFGSFYAAFDPKNNNEMVCHLNPYNLKEALGGGTSVRIDGKEVRISECNIMWCLPKIYLSLSADGNTMTLASDASRGGTLASAFTLKDGTKSIDYNFLAFGVYEAWIDNTESTKKVYSYPDKSPPVSISIANFQTYAHASGAGEGGRSMLWNFYQWQLYRFCSLAVMQNFDSQAQIGNGIVYTFGKANTGSTYNQGPYYGTTADSGTAEKLFIENAWGNVYECVGDAYMTSEGIWVGHNYTQVSGTANGLNGTGLKFAPGGRGEVPDTNPEHLDTWALPTKTGDDGYDWVETTNDCTLLVGGHWADGSKAGISFIHQGGLGGGTGVGSRLAFLFANDSAAPTIPEVTYNHDDLRALLKEFGYSEDPVNKLPNEPRGNGTYDDLGEVEEFKHAGWIIDGELYPVDYQFVKTEDHEAKSVWIGLPAVTYDHTELIARSQDQSSTVGLSNGLEIRGHDSYEQLPPRNGYSHVGWLIEFDGQAYKVGPTDRFVTKNSHTATSLWTEIPTVTFDHSNLTDIVGTTAKGITDLQTSMTIEGNSNYPQLPNTAGYRHTGWEIDGKAVGPTATLESETTHKAKSLWQKISVIPIFPDGDDGADVIEVTVQNNSEPWLGKSGKSVVLLAAVVVIIAELAVLCISRKRRSGPSQRYPTGFQGVFWH